MEFKRCDECGREYAAKRLEHGICEQCREDRVRRSLRRSVKPNRRSSSRDADQQYHGHDYEG